MTQATFIGQQYASDGSPVTDLVGRRLLALSYIARTFGGYTASDSHGGWIDPTTDKLVSEPSLMLTVLTDAPSSELQDAASRLAGMFDQSSVVLSQANASVQFVPYAQAIAA